MLTFRCMSVDLAIHHPQISSPKIKFQIKKQLSRSLIHKYGKIKMRSHPKHIIYIGKVLPIGQIKIESLGTFLQLYIKRNDTFALLIIKKQTNHLMFSHMNDQRNQRNLELRNHLCLPNPS